MFWSTAKFIDLFTVFFYLYWITIRRNFYIRLALQIGLLLQCFSFCWLCIVKGICHVRFHTSSQSLETPVGDWPNTWEVGRWELRDGERASEWVSERFLLLHCNVILEVLGKLEYFVADDRGVVTVYLDARVAWPLLSVVWLIANRVFVGAVHVWAETKDCLASCFSSIIIAANACTSRQVYLWTCAFCYLGVCVGMRIVAEVFYCSGSDILRNGSRKRFGWNSEFWLPVLSYYQRNVCCKVVDKLYIHCKSETVHVWKL